MKHNHFAQIACLASLAGAVPAGAQTVDDYIVDQFGDEFGVYDYTTAWGIAPFFEWDGTENSTEHPDNPAGAMKVTVDFDIATYLVDNQTAFQRSFLDTIDFGEYTHIHFDVKVDESSSRLSTSWGTGQFGSIDLIARTSDWTTQLNSITTSDPWLGVDDYGEWRHFALPVDQTLLNHHDMSTLMFHIWSGWVEADNVSGGHTGPVVFWFDNLYLEKNTSTAPPPPPALSFEPATAGLQLIASQSGSQWQRQGLHTTSETYSWVGAPGPVTYEITVKSAPGKDGFQAHMFLVPNSTAGETAPDWAQPDVVFVSVIDHGDGTGHASFGFKTDQPNGNSQIYGENHLADLQSASVVGMWAVTFENDTDVRLTAPDGATVDFAMDADAVARFADPLTVYFGAQPNNLDYIGSGFVFENITVTGVPDPIDDSFASPDLDPAVWTLAAEGPAGVFVAAADAEYWLTWTLPAVGFVPQVSGTLGTASWADLDIGRSFQIGMDRTMLLTASDLPSGDDSFFRMLQRQFEKLQVLVPGESPAPGMPGGKTGTPLPQEVGVPFDVVVNSVDAADNLAPIGRDVLFLTSSDITALLPADAPLVGGTRTFSVTFYEAGSHTISVGDFTDPAIAEVTSSPITANP